MVKEKPANHAKPFSRGAIPYLPAVILLLVLFFAGVAHTPSARAQGMAGTVSVNVTMNPTLNQQILTDTIGMTLYVFARDTSGVSNCSGQCATIWLAVQPALQGFTPNLDPSATGTLTLITRSDGTQQVAYNGMPLYYYSQDMNPGDAKGQGVAGVWSAATP
jgi:predicted lipoprotein with Yx(FWY)xxD motif